MFAMIRRVIDAEARLTAPAAELTPAANLYAAGLTPYSAVRVLLALERELDVELPRAALTRATMESMAAIAEAFARAKGLSVAA
jgi:acyl carrier protein